jgi:hypothetical protein
VALVTSAWYVDNGLSPSTAYGYTVAALDAAGGESAQSSSVNAMTKPPILPPPILVFE